MALNPSNGSNLERLGLKGLRLAVKVPSDDDDDEIAYFTVR